MENLDITKPRYSEHVLPVSRCLDPPFYVFMKVFQHSDSFLLQLKEKNWLTVFVRAKNVTEKKDIGYLSPLSSFVL